MENSSSDVVVVVVVPIIIVDDSVNERVDALGVRCFYHNYFLKKGLNWSICAN